MDDTHATGAEDGLMGEAGLLISERSLGTDAAPRRFPLYRRAVATTPSLLRLACTVLLIALVTATAAGVVALKSRADAARDVTLRAAPLLKDAEQLYVELADADATSSRAFLQGSLEDRDTRTRYEGDLASANARLAELGREAGTDPDARQAIAIIGRGLPRYSSRVAAARANNRLGYPVGAAYLRQASTQVQLEIQPAATTVLRHASNRLDRDYDHGTSTLVPIIAIVLGCALLLGIIATQILVFRRTNRVVNVGLASATVLVCLAATGVTLQVVESQRDLVRAADNGSDPAQILVSARLLTLRAQSASTASVIDRQPSSAPRALLDRLDGPGGLIPKGSEAVSALDSQLRQRNISQELTTFRTELTKIQNALHDRDFERAEQLALSTELTTTTTHLDESFGAAIDSTQARIDDAARNARTTAGWTAVVVIAFAIAAALLILFGLFRRIAEYR